MVNKKILLAIFMAFIIPLSACSEGNKSSGLAIEIAARRLGLQAKSLEAEGKDQEAADVYAEIAATYGETKYYLEELVPELQKNGISIKDSLTSKTVKQMFKLQNMLVKFKKKNGYYPEGNAIQIPKDVWGNSILYKKSEGDNPKYEFFVISKGADGKLKTDDDIYTVYTGQKSEAAKYGDAGGAKPVKKKKKRRVAGVMSIEDLEKQAREDATADGQEATEGTMSLQELNKKSKSGKKRKPSKNTTGEKEIVKSLDEL